jgi:CRP-like cAMP-binding protein
MAKTRRTGKATDTPALRANTGNKLLDALPASEYRRLQPLLAQAVLREGQVLHATDERFQAVYFPVGGVCSIVAPMEDGRSVEVATVGSEGMIGLSALFGSRLPAGEAVAQLPGTSVQALPIEAFAAELRRRGVLHDLLCRYATVMLGVLVQSAACNGLHGAEERTARWLLHARDRTGSNTVPLTQETLGGILGVRRATITAVINRFQRQHLIEFGRRRVVILDRHGLESLACECYRIVRGQFARMS